MYFLTASTLLFSFSHSDDGEQHLIVANFGNNDNINLSSLNITAADNAMGDVVLATPNAGHQPGLAIIENYSV